jgi:hypothetical protein
MSQQGDESVKTMVLKQRVVVGVLGVMLFASGCQTVPSPTPVVLDNTGFMSLWETYNNCRISSDLSQASSDMNRLAVAAKLHDNNDGFVLPLPSELERLVSQPTSRLAVDVQAMNAACSLHTGQLALNQGQTDVARDAFSSVVTLHKEQSSYYVLQAKKFLTEMERGIDISLKTP